MYTLHTVIMYNVSELLHIQGVNPPTWGESRRHLRSPATSTAWPSAGWASSEETAPRTLWRMQCMRHKSAKDDEPWGCNLPKNSMIAIIRQVHSTNLVGWHPWNTWYTCEHIAWLPQPLMVSHHWRNHWHTRTQAGRSQGSEQQLEWTHPSAVEKGWEFLS